MSTELAPAPVTTRAVPRLAEGSLTWRASLNLAQALLDYGGKLVVGLVVVPIVVTGLGRSIFGVWEMLGRLMGYLESTDGRPTQALRLVISSLQSQEDPREKRRWIGGALVVWLCFLPLWLAAGGVLVWLAPSVTKVAAGLVWPVRFACMAMMLGILLAGLASLPESVLRGMNLGYKRMGLQASLSLAGGALTVGAVAAGLGLVGVALAGVGLTLLTGLCFLTLARRQIPWFGAERPGAREVFPLLRMSLWIAGGDAVAKLLLASDVLILGMVLASSTVTTYVLTGYAALLSVNLHSLVADSAIPGIAGIIGQKDHRRAAVLRRELLVITLLFISAAGTAILACNRSFVGLWVGNENYAGSWVNLLLVLTAAQTTFIRCDAYILDAALQPGRRVQVSAVAAAVALSLGVLLTHYAGMIGLCLGVLAGRSIQSVWYPVLVRRYLGDVTQPTSTWLLRPLLTLALLYGTAGYLATGLVLRDWITWAFAVLLSAGAGMFVMLRLGLPRELQASVSERMLELSRRLGRSLERKA